MTPLKTVQNLHDDDLTWEEARDRLVSDDGTGPQTQVGQRCEVPGDWEYWKVNTGALLPSDRKNVSTICQEDLP